MEEIVVIVGAGPSGLATSACLNFHSIPNLVLERECCCASLWKMKSYDSATLHLAKQFCQLPHMPYPSNSPTFMSKLDFIQYIDDYVSKFNIKPRYNRSVELTKYDKFNKKWRIEVKNMSTGEIELYNARFLVVATGENDKGFIPQVEGLERFEGDIVHSSQYKSGKEYGGKKVLVVGCGNSGMEIAYDLENFGACTSIVIRSNFHVLTKRMVHLGMVLLKFLPLRFVDRLTISLANLYYGDLSKYGIHRPSRGAFEMKFVTGKSPVIDVGTVEKIKRGVIDVVPEICKIGKKYVMFNNGEMRPFDAIIFATGYRSTAHNWLQDDDDSMLGSNGMPKKTYPNHWKGTKGLYCAGLSKRGLLGTSMDAEAIANDINSILTSTDQGAN